MNRLQRIETMIYALASPTHKPALHGGLLKIINRSGSVHTAGDGCGPVFTIEIRNTRVLQKIYSNPDLMLGETYVNGEWDLIQGDLGQFTSWVVRNYKDDIARMPQKELRQNTVPNSRKHVAHHYDMGNDLYESFLDVGMNYSCAFFDDHRMSLRDAQLNKIYTTINRLDVRPGMNVLDIGCGWGETCRTLAHYAPGVNVTGITLSQKQLDGALSVNAKAGINNPHYVLTDYREHAQSHACRYDRIVSIGMFEHVGHRHYHNYFKAIEKLLKPGGQALVHSIMRPEPGRGTSPVARSLYLSRWLHPLYAGSTGYCSISGPGTGNPALYTPRPQLCRNLAALASELQF